MKPLTRLIAAVTAFASIACGSAGSPDGPDETTWSDDTRASADSAHEGDVETKMGDTSSPNDDAAAASPPDSDVHASLGCPVALGTITPSEGLLIGDEVALDPSRSESPAGVRIVGGSWTVVSPSGMESTVAGTTDTPPSVIKLSEAGEWSFSLTVTDADGTDSCQPWVSSVIVATSPAMQIELTWNGIPDPGPLEPAPDLDLHVARLVADESGADLDADGEPDPWFGEHDVFWFQPAEARGAGISRAQRPSLEVDDVGYGTGESVIVRAEPTGPLSLAIAVHFYRDNGLEQALATLRVRRSGVVVFERTDVPMEKSDLWKVTVVSWPGPTFMPAADAPDTEVVVPKYSHPSFSVHE